MIGFASLKKIKELKCQVIKVNEHCLYRWFLVAAGRNIAMGSIRKSKRQIRFVIRSEDRDSFEWTLDCRFLRLFPICCPYVMLRCQSPSWIFQRCSSSFHCNSKVLLQSVASEMQEIRAAREFSSPFAISKRGEWYVEGWHNWLSTEQNKVWLHSKRDSTQCPGEEKMLSVKFVKTSHSYLPKIEPWSTIALESIEVIRQRTTPEDPSPCGWPGRWSAPSPRRTKWSKSRTAKLKLDHCWLVLCPRGAKVRTRRRSDRAAEKRNSFQIKRYDNSFFKFSHESFRMFNS